jgi:20S proteasome alpha/beta subunit
MASSIREKVHAQSRTWGRKMTVGIACQCLHNDEFAIALCCDWQATYGHMIKSEDLHKIREAGKASILFADDPAAADELVARITPMFKNYDALDKSEENFDLRISQLLADLREVVKEINAERREFMLSTKYNTNSELFRKEGKDNFPSDMYYTILGEIGKIGLGCDLIIAYNADCDPIIIEVTGADCTVRWVDDYAVIGSGGWIARAIMCQDEETDGATYMNLMDCISTIYFAKRAAQKDPNVGKYSSILVLTKTGEFELTDAGVNFFNEQMVPIKAPKGLNYDQSFFTSA